MNQRLKNWLLVFFWAGLIFFLSHQPDLKVGQSDIFNFILSKLAHVTEYAILSLFLIRALSEEKIFQRKALLFSVILALLYAVSDEFHQTFILGRHGTITDIFIDSIGIFLASVWFFIYRIKK